MAFDLLNSVKGFFANDQIGKAANSFGESETGISKALSGIIPSVLGGIISKATANMDGANSILNLAKGAAASVLPGNLGQLLEEKGGGSLVSNGLDMLKQLLGDKVSSITGAISRFAGIRESSVSSLMAVVAPVALSFIGKHAVENNLTPGSLSNLLSNQKTSVTAALPAGLATLAGLTGLGGIGGAVVSRPPVAVHEEKKTGNSRRWTLPVIFAIAIIVLVWLILRGCNKEGAANVPIADTTAANTQIPASTERVSIKVGLPDGVELDAYKGGIEDRLVMYLNSTDPADSISNNRWFDFDNLNFKTGSADLTEESMKQVQNIAAILKAYPKVSIKIGGYTDKTGKEEENMKLSQKRAESVLDAVRKAGTTDAQLAGAEGYGSQFARAAADAPDEERKPDRRISVSVRNK